MDEFMQWCHEYTGQVDTDPLYTSAPSWTTPEWEDPLWWAARAVADHLPLSVENINDLRVAVSRGVWWARNKELHGFTRGRSDYRPSEIVDVVCDCTWNVCRSRNSDKRVRPIDIVQDIATHYMIKYAEGISPLINKILTVTEWAMGEIDNIPPITRIWMYMRDQIMLSLVHRFALAWIADHDDKNGNHDNLLEQACSAAMREHFEFYHGRLRSAL